MRRSPLRLPLAALIAGLVGFGVAQVAAPRPNIIYVPVPSGETLYMAEMRPSAVTGALETGAVQGAEASLRILQDRGDLVASGTLPEERGYFILFRAVSREEALATVRATPLVASAGMEVRLRTLRAGFSPVR